MDGLRELCIEYPVLQSVELSFVILCAIPSILLLITVQGAPFHVNCRVLITLWTLAHLVEYAIVVAYLFRMAQYENNEIPRSFFVPAERSLFLVAQLDAATVATFLELGITLERAASVHNPAMYHSSRLAVKHIFSYFLSAIFVSILLGWFAIEGPLTSSAMVSAVILNCIDMSSFLSNIAVLRYCRLQYAKIFAKTSLNARYQVREANNVAHAMLPAYISMISIKVALYQDTSGRAVVDLYFRIEKMGLFFLNEASWVCLQLLNNGCGATFFLIKHERLRLRLTTLLFRRKSRSLVVPAHAKSARGDQYFDLLNSVWK